VKETRCVLDPTTVPASFADLPSTTCPYLGSGAAVSGDGEHVVYAASEDNAGNIESIKSASFGIDTSAPTDDPKLTGGTLGSNGWYTSDVTVTWNWIDTGGSGIDPSNCPATSTTSGEGDNVVASATCYDLAGNKTSDSQTFKVDKTPPSDNPKVTGGTLGSNGWYTSDVTVTWNWIDTGGSGIDPSNCPATTTTSGEGSSVKASTNCKDIAGNSASDSQTFKVDKTPPTVMVTGVLDGAQYVVGAVPTADCKTTDLVSLVATSATVGITTTGSNGVGSFTAKCSGAVDNAGNKAAPVSVTYTVVYGFGGFLSPVPKSSLVYNSGSTIPVKFTLTNASGQPIAATTAAALAANNEVEATLTGPNGGTTVNVSALCTWNTTGHYFQCNIKTPTLKKTSVGSTNAYLITAQEKLTGTFVTAPPFNPGAASDANPETIYFQ
jgi:hypothetical protein